MAAYQQQLAAYQQQAELQSTAFRDQLQQQIDAVAAQTQQAQQQAAAMAANSPAAVQGSYGVTTAQAQAANPQVTETMEQRKVQRSNLRIAQAATATTAGAGLNIGA
jgi:hypothetical protein